MGQGYCTSHEFVKFCIFGLFRAKSSFLAGLLFLDFGRFSKHRELHGAIFCCVHQSTCETETRKAGSTGSRRDGASRVFACRWYIWVQCLPAQQCIVLQSGFALRTPFIWNSAFIFSNRASSSGGPCRAAPRPRSGSTRNAAAQSACARVCATSSGQTRVSLLPVGGV